MFYVVRELDFDLMCYNGNYSWMRNYLDCVKKKNFLELHNILLFKKNILIALIYQ